MGDKSTSNYEPKLTILINYLIEVINSSLCVNSLSTMKSDQDPGQCIFLSGKKVSLSTEA